MAASPFNVSVTAEGLARHLRRSYGIEVSAMRALDVAVWRIDRRDGASWVARVFPRERPLAAAPGDAGILLSLERRGFPAERCAQDEAVTVLDVHPVLVTDFVESADPLSPGRQAALLGALLGRLHAEQVSTEVRPGGAWHHLSSTGVGQWTRARFGIALPAERTAVFGTSAGGELALALGLRHPDIYGAIFSASPGAGFKPTGAMPSRIPRTYLVAGTLEPFFLDNATRWAVALRDAGADVVMSERVASHGPALWRAELPLMVAWAFGQ
jgi:hypothetical protein